MTLPTDGARWTSCSERILSFSNQLLQRTIDAWTRLLIDRASTERLDATKATLGMVSWLENHDRLGFADDESWRSLNPNDDIGALRWLLERCEPLATLQSTQPTALESAPWRDLIESIHRAIGLLSARDSFSESVERSARRQVHNLAYGLTHEINNPLGNIVARAQQLIRVVPTESDRRSMATVVDQAMRAHEMLAEVMRAVQPKDLQLATNDLASLLQAHVESMRARAQEAKLEWSFHGPDEPIYANINTDALTEVLRLIGQNAIDVCPPHAMVVWDCRTVLSIPFHSNTAANTLWVCISIRDTGPGLSASAARQATDLFYSGREYGRGLGVSLAVVRRIVESHHGHFQIRSDSHAGCTIEIYLPIADSPEPKRPRVRL
jgi:signal transduction histidine kinase